jgi:hypothetical protein
MMLTAQINPFSNSVAGNLFMTISFLLTSRLRQLHATLLEHGYRRRTP